jgi:excisionase family DNA binding protein
MRERSSTLLYTRDYEEAAMNLLTVDETAAMLRVNPVTIRRYIKSGRLPAVRVGRHVRIEKEAAEALATPIVLSANQVPVEKDVFRKPSPEEIARRRALFQQILADREDARIVPLTTADLIHMARAEEEQRYGEG